MSSRKQEHSVEEKILDAFRRHPGTFVSGEELSHQLGISRAAIWKYIEHLRSLGYIINAQPHHGYQLGGVPDRLLPHEIKWELATSLIGKEVIVYDAVDSTNIRAHQHAQDYAEDGTAIIAEEQTKGKGRLGRTWISPKGCGIYCSIILKPRILPTEAPEITLIGAVSVAKAIRDITKCNAQIKWPNDIMVNGKKVCGLLTEMQAEQDMVQYVILGFGVNVQAQPGILPEEAGVLTQFTNTSFIRVDLLKEIFRQFEHYYINWLAHGFEPVVEEWRALSCMLGHRVRAQVKDRQIEGQAMDIDERGSLIVRLDNGFTEHISAGDVNMVRS